MRNCHQIFLDWIKTAVLILLCSVSPRVLIKSVNEDKSHVLQNCFVIFLPQLLLFAINLALNSWKT